MTSNRATAAGGAALCAALLFGAAACGSSSSGPTSADAGRQLSRDARALLGDTQKLLVAPAPYTVSTDSVGAASASACGKGKERRSFAGRMRVPATPNAHLAMITDQGDADGYLVQRGYSLDTHAAQAQSDTERSAVMVDKKAGLHISVVLTPAPGGKLLDYAVTGTTDCLATS